MVVKVILKRSILTYLAVFYGNELHVLILLNDCRFKYPIKEEMRELFSSGIKDNMEPYLTYNEYRGSVSL